MKQIIVSRVFPQTHPRKGEPTHFVEKIWASIGQSRLVDAYCFLPGETEPFWDICGLYEPKHHTIRAGKRWKDGERAVIKVWSGKPYRSTTITVTPPLTLRVMDINIYPTMDVWVNGKYYGSFGSENLTTLALNDGLSHDDFRNWFINKNFEDFKGQILCWNPDINY